MANSQRTSLVKMPDSETLQETERGNFLVRWVQSKYGWWYALFLLILLILIPEEAVTGWFIGPFAFLDEAVAAVIVVFWPIFKRAVLFFWGPSDKD